MKGLSHHATCVAAATACIAALGCTAPGTPGADPSELEPYVVGELPVEATPAFVDFGGRLHLVAKMVTPSDAVTPGGSVDVKWFWKPVTRIGKGWGLFTHIESETGRQLANYDSEGAFRAFLKSKPEGLAALTPGLIYVDEQQLNLPKAEDLTPDISVIVGVWNDKMRLPIVSGASNGHEAAFLAHLSTGITRPARDDKPRPSRPSIQ